MIYILEIIFNALLINLEPFYFSLPYTKTIYKISIHNQHIKPGSNLDLSCIQQLDTTPFCEKFLVPFFSKKCTIWPISGGTLSF